MNPCPNTGRSDKLAVDSMAGGLAKWMRFLGYDTVFLRHGPVRILPDRVLLTRRTARPHQPRLAGWRRVIRLTANDTMGQLAETVRLLPVRPEEARPMTVCARCNHPLEPISAAEAVSLVPDYVHATQGRYRLCRECGRVYWPGTHHRRLMEVIEGLWRT